MTKVMIVDDEKLIVDGLAGIINWDKLNIKIVSKAYDGLEALENFKIEPVDIVITDITMPKMDGLCLIENIKTFDKNVKFIILSGYDEFSYAKKAIELGIENYILKPINEEELESTLENTIKKIEKEKSAHYLIEQDIDTIKENIYVRWILNSISQFELLERQEIIDIDLKYMNYCVAIMKLQNNENRTFEASKIIKELNKKYKSRDIIFFKDMEDNVVIINGWNGENLISFKNTLEKNVIFINENYKNNIFTTIGEVQILSENIYKSYNNARELQNYLLVFGYNKIIETKNVISNEDKQNDNIKMNLDDFYKDLLSKDKEKTFKFIEDIFDKMRQNENITPDLIRNTASSIIFIIRKTAIELNITDKAEYDDLTKLILSVSSKETLNEVEDFIKKESEKIADNVAKYNYKLSPVVQQIITYVNHNYKEEMSLKLLADKYNMNTSYLGQIFLKELGCSFSEYLNKIKNEKAKDLLLNTNMRINEISKEVGYIDTSYFYKKFKKFYGVSPNILRNSKQY